MSTSTMHWKTRMRACYEQTRAKTAAIQTVAPEPPPKKLKTVSVQTVPPPTYADSGTQTANRQPQTRDAGVQKYAARRVSAGTQVVKAAGVEMGTQFGGYADVGVNAGYVSAGVGVGLDDEELKYTPSFVDARRTASTTISPVHDTRPALVPSDTQHYDDEEDDMMISPDILPSDSPVPVAPLSLAPQRKDSTSASSATLIDTRSSTRDSSPLAPSPVATAAVAHVKAPAREEVVKPPATRPALAPPIFVPASVTRSAPKPAPSPAAPTKPPPAASSLPSKPAPSSLPSTPASAPTRLPAPVIPSLPLRRSSNSTPTPANVLDAPAPLPPPPPPPPSTIPPPPPPPTSAGIKRPRSPPSTKVTGFVPASTSKSAFDAAAEWTPSKSAFSPATTASKDPFAADPFAALESASASKKANFPMPEEPMDVDADADVMRFGRRSSTRASGSGCSWDPERGTASRNTDYLLL
ncbi:hypothetical protein EXIGLDRAFT_349930 [Exidia glandulosa HHB12029]|uniref:Uncharacterized protein n=1 Tax=Exidia glandulosa HHB12029 TaxID=1314781 RepID=A0A165CDR0_EXIGL|nr:hypothetical protein EXIGLDRAFT_349930 [Exidia glandulosa HHB12029]